MDLPFSLACEKNKGPILEVLLNVILSSDRRALEIGSGSGQHVEYFAPFFPQIEWFPTEIPKNFLRLTQWYDQTNISNIQKPTRLDIAKDDFPKLKFDVVYTSNTLHVMHWKECKVFFKLLGNRLREGSRAIFYGPFKYEGQFTSDNNALLDESLKRDDPLMGIRSFEDVQNNMIKNGFELLEDFDMPDHNQMLVFQRLKFEKRR